MQKGWTFHYIFMFLLILLLTACGNGLKTKAPEIQYLSPLPPSKKTTPKSSSEHSAKKPTSEPSSEHSTKKTTSEPSSEHSTKKPSPEPSSEPSAKKPKTEPVESMTKEHLARAIEFGKTFKKDDLLKQYKDLDLVFNPNSMKFQPTEELKTKLDSFGNDNDKWDFEEKWIKDHVKIFEFIQKKPGFIDYYRIYRMPAVNGKVVFSGSMTRFKGDNEGILIGKELAIPKDFLFQASFQWQYPPTRIKEEPLIQFYIKTIGIGAGHQTGTGIGTPATLSLIKFVENNQLADLITVYARTPASERIFEKMKFTPTGSTSAGDFDMPISPNTESYNYYKIISNRGEKIISEILKQKSEKK